MLTIVNYNDNSILLEKWMKDGPTYHFILIEASMSVLEFRLSNFFHHGVLCLSRIDNAWNLRDIWGTGEAIPVGTLD